MTTFDRSSLVAQLKKHEAVKLKPYIDSVGKLTIGVGRNLDDVGITAAEADFLLQGDIDRVTRGLLARYPIWFADLDPVRQAVLVNMAFNLGVAGLAAFTTTLAAVAAHQFDLAARAMLNSTWATQVGARATEVATQMRTGTGGL